MNHQLLAYMSPGDDFASALIMYGAITCVIFFIGLYIFRAIFNIPSFLRYQRAQIRLLEEIAKTQGVDDTKVQGIISESMGWDQSATQSASSNSTQQ